MSNKQESRLEDISRLLSKPMKNIPFADIIQNLYEVSVKKFDGNTTQNKKILETIKLAMKDVCEAVQKKPIERPRPNEVGNDMEKPVLDALVEKGLRAGWPKTKAGKGKSTGYPDIRIAADGNEAPIYLEVKSYAPEQRATALRSFYLSPSKCPESG